jgi:hypothetical protein
MEYQRGEWNIFPNPEGEYVLAGDAVAAITAADERGCALAYAKGQRNMLAKCIEAVELLLHKPGASGEHYLTALRALEEKP